MNLNRRFLPLLLAVSCGLSAGCAARVQNVTNLPPGVTLQQAQAWDSAVANLHKISTTVSAFRQTLTDLHNAQYNGAPVLSDEYYAHALTAIARIDQVEVSVEYILRQSPQNFSLTAKQQVAALLQQITAQIQALNAEGATGIKNPKSLQQVNTLLAEVTSIVGLILSL